MLIVVIIDMCLLAINDGWCYPHMSHLVHSVALLSTVNIGLYWNLGSMLIRYYLIIVNGNWLINLLLVYIIILK